MSCNILQDKRVDFKTQLPADIGDFWLQRGTDSSKEIVRLFTRLSLQNNALSYIDYVENLLSVTTAHINTLPSKLKVSDLEVSVKNFTPENFSTTAHNGFPIESLVPLRKTDANREGVYALDPETMRIWQDSSGEYWIWHIEKDPENYLSPYPTGYVITNTVYFKKQTEYSVELIGSVPTMILSKKGYLLYGLDFRVETGYLLFTEPLEQLFDNYIHIVSGYEKRKTLFGFPFSVDPETPGVEHITKFLRYNSSSKNLEKALSQVVGYSSVPNISIIMKQMIPDGNILIGSNGELITVSQDAKFLDTYSLDEFPGKPVTVISGDDPNLIELITTKSKFILPSTVGNIILEDRDYLCRITVGDFVEINLGDFNTSEYSSSLRKELEQIIRLDDNGDPLPTLSEYLIGKYGTEDPGVGDEFYVNILREYIALFGKTILFILFSEDLTHEQRQAAIDFLETHTPANAIILTDTIWE